MNRFSRRQFLTWLAALSGAAAAEPLLSACSRAGIPVATQVSSRETLATAIPPANTPYDEQQPGNPTGSTEPPPTGSAPAESEPTETPAALDTLAAHP
ncbi:MAG: hypothetical protein ACWGO1_07335, partial [Anaerolineales bacterium]